MNICPRNYTKHCVPHNAIQDGIYNMKIKDSPSTKNAGYLWNFKIYKIYFIANRPNIATDSCEREKKSPWSPIAFAQRVLPSNATLDEIKNYCASRCRRECESSFIVIWPGEYTYLHSRCNKFYACTDTRHRWNFNRIIWKKIARRRDSAAARRVFARPSNFARR